MQFLVSLLLVTLRVAYGHDDACTSESCLSSVALLQASVKLHGQANQSADKPIAAVYRGPAGDGTSAGDVLDGTGQWQVVYVGPNDLSIADGLNGAELYVQPGGGDDYMVNWNAVKDYKDAITKFVGSGGAFIGVCAGAHLSNDHPPLFPGFGLSSPFAETFDYVDQPGAEIKDAKDYVITVNWRSVPQQVYFQNGPGFNFADKLSEAGKQQCQVLAKYQNGDIAAMTMPYRSGSVGIMGPHPEIPYGDVFPSFLFVDLVNTVMGCGEVEVLSAEFAKTGHHCAICASIGQKCGDHRAKHHNLAAQSAFGVANASTTNATKGDAPGKGAGSSLKMCLMIGTLSFASFSSSVMQDS